MSHQGAMTSSDERIKKNIVDADDAECLETLRLLKPKKYEYKDAVRGKEPVWGFIAQEVKETLPLCDTIEKRCFTKHLRIGECLFFRRHHIHEL